MTKSLLLMRHGKSSWKDKDLPDKKRPLKKRGAEGAEAVGEILKASKLVPELILCSPAKRTEQTAEIVAKKSGYKGDIKFQEPLYMAEPSTIMHALQDLSDKLDRVMVIGHNPGLEALLQILDGKVDSMPTGSLAFLNLDIKSWKDLSFDSNGELIRFWDAEHEDRKEKRDKKDKH